MEMTRFDDMGGGVCMYVEWHATRARQGGDCLVGTCPAGVASSTESWRGEGGKERGGGGGGGRKEEGTGDLGKIVKMLTKRLTGQRPYLSRRAC